MSDAQTGESWFAATVEVDAAALKDHPEVVNSDPHTTWMIKVRMTNPADTSALLDSTQYQGLLG